MIQFDQTTERKALEWDATPENWMSGSAKALAVRSFSDGRNSAKESLEIACRALLETSTHTKFKNGVGITPTGGAANALKAIADIKARGDWPLGD